MARPYKKRKRKPTDFKICDLTAMKEKCLCSIDNVCVCAKLKGICISDSAENAAIALTPSQLTPITANGAFSLPGHPPVK